MDNKVIFRGEIAVSVNNPRVYDDIYIIENWFRRVLYSALMMRFGNRWVSFFTEENLKNHEKMMNQDDKELNELRNIVWATDFRKLIEYMRDEQIVEIIEEFTEAKYKGTASKLHQIADIRNSVAHNRAISLSTYNEFKKLKSEINTVLSKFKKNLIYEHEAGKIVLEEHESQSQVCKYFLNRMKNNDGSGLQAFIRERKYHYGIVHLPCSSLKSYPYVNIKLIIDKYEGVLNDILGLFINKTGDEYYILVPRHESISLDHYKEIIDIFVNLIDDIWTDERYEEQMPTYVCNPKIWFYENRIPDHIGIED